jgi:hypothetical protein
MDNCGATHLVNSKDLLEPGTFVPATLDKTVEAGSSALPILGHGTRIMKRALHGASGPDTADLILKEVAVVEGFHVNIVSEARLLESGVWYSGFDCTLRYGDEKDSVILKRLKRLYNLVFLEYKPYSTYSHIPPEIPTSMAGILVFPTVERRLRSRYRRSRDYLKPRSDEEEVWHARAGHLGPWALQALVKNCRNVIIKGTARVKCEHCAQTHAAKVISRRQSEHRSARPFYRVSWDLFDFEEAFNGSSWMLMIKDEYSGKLYPFDLKSKAQSEVYPTIRRFERWVKRQYGLSICKLRHDGDKSVIAINGKSQYQLWAEQEGIDLEVTPSYTHEPNGAAERAGQEVITKSIKMREGAGFPVNLWPEVTCAAAYLYNKSPSYEHDLRAPDKLLDQWFRNYFRWYDPALITRVTTDLRPDWNGIYAYGCRAYPMNKEREAGRDKRAFKVFPRGHIGYLIGYVASNIYRIWVPVLGRVIITRNVTFDEGTFYRKEQEKEEGQPLSVVQQLVELIEEDEVQDAESILENIGLWDDNLPERTIEFPHLGGETELLSLDPEGQNSGVRAEKTPADDQQGHGLITPTNTPEPESMPVASESVEATEPQRRLSVIGEEEGDSGTRQGKARSTDTNQGRTSPMDQATDPQNGNPTSLERQEGEPTAKSKRTYTKRTYEKTRGSARIKNRAPNTDSDEAGSGGSAVFSTLSSLLTTLAGSENTDHLESLLSSLWPDQLIELEEGDEKTHRTVHAVIAASVLQNSGHRNQPEIGPIPRIHQNELPKAPKSWNDLERHPLGVHFKADAIQELQNLESRDCWRVVPRTENTPPLIPLKWVFTYKPDSDGYLTRCRSRIVVRGDLQEESSVISTYAATLAARSFRVIAAIAAHFDLEIEQFDMVNAFVNAKRPSGSVLVACQLPDGFKQLGMCVEIDRALYGLRDSPALWFKELTSTLSKLGLKGCKEEPCIFIDLTHKVFVLFYVDDVLVMYHKSDQAYAKEIVLRMNKAYKLRKMGDISWFLGVRVIRDRAQKKLWLVHDTYIQKMAAKFQLIDGNTPSTPLPVLELVKFTGEAHPKDVKRYQEKVGTVLYTAILIRPDVAYAAAMLSQFLSNPGPEHFVAVNWTIKYLFGTRFLALEYNAELKDVNVMIASDASFADDPVTRRSAQGYLIQLFGGAIIWKATRQSTVTTSTTEAELLALKTTAQETMALIRFFKDLKLDLGELWTIFCDNQQTIRLVVGENERVTTKLRHVDIQNMWLRQEHAKGVFEVSYLPTNSMPADGLTKSLSRQKFEHFRSLLNLQDVRGKIEKIE